MLKTGPARNTQEPRLITPKKLALLQVYSPLMFSLFYFIGPVYNPINAWHIALVIIIFFVQVLLYHITATTKHNRTAFIAILCSIALGFGGTYTNQTAYAFYWFSTYFAAARFSLANAIGVLLTVIASVCTSAYVFDVYFMWFFFSSLIPGIGLFFYGLYDKQERRHTSAKERTNEQIEQLAKVAERERIARDLHDVMGHSLTTIALKAQLADKQARNGDMDAAQQEIANVAQLSRDTLSEMRAVISGYKARSLDHHIEQLTTSLNNWGFHVEQDIAFPELDAQQESTVSLVLTEAITNIIKHCKGDYVTLRTEIQPERHPDASWALHICDNGTVKSVDCGNGLNGMRERLESIHAILDIDRRSGMHIAVYFRDAQ